MCTVHEPFCPRKTRKARKFLINTLLMVITQKENARHGTAYCSFFVSFVDKHFLSIATRYKSALPVTSSIANKIRVGQSGACFSMQPLIIKRLLPMTGNFASK